MTGPAPIHPNPALRDAGRWIALAVGSIAVAGSFALYLAIARIPGLETALAPDPQFGWRGLIVHVNLALGVWFSTCIAALFCLLPGVRGARVTPVAQALALAGVLGFSATLFIREAEPIRSNYVPVLDHWLFLLGLGAFFGAVALSFADRRLLPATGPALMPAEAQPGLRAAAVAYLAAMATIGATWVTQADGLTPLQYYERMFWGGGHVLQVANVLGMVAAWLFLLSRVVQREVVNPLIARVLFVLLLLPVLAGPYVATLPNSRGVFTEMMRWGIFPVVSVFIILCVASVLRRPRVRLKNIAFVGFATSACMTVAGFILGAMIRGSDTTLVPGHYHMSIGAVTAAFMAAILVLLEPLGAPLRTARGLKLAVWQPLMFGGGQAVMAIGFAVAGVAGAERKAYGSDQVVRSTGEWIGLSVMALGAVLASVGGIIFLVLVIRAWRMRH